MEFLRHPDRPSRGESGTGILDRFDHWVKGPKPDPHWWIDGGFMVDERGPALLDCIGRRHSLPQNIAAIVLRDSPTQLLAIDSSDQLIAQLPTLGFTDTILQAFADAAGWNFRHESNPGWNVIIDPIRPSFGRNFLDLREAPFRAA